MTARKILELDKSARTLWETRSPEEKRDMLKQLLQNQTLEGRTVRYDLINPLRALSEMRQEEDWRARASEYRTSVLEMKLAIEDQKRLDQLVRSD